MKYIIGISAYYHDSAAALITDSGEIVCAVQEERFTRIKHDSSFPKQSVKFFLSEFNLDSKDIEAIIFYEKPFLKFERLLETYINFFPKGFFQFLKSMPIWVTQKLFQEREIRKNLNEINEDFKDKKIFFSDHHLSHAASAYFPSKFNKSAILTADGVGEWCTTTISIGNKNNIEIVKEIHFPHSIGLLYSAFTFYCGFKVNDGEYKLMGLAPYGKPIYEKIIKDEIVNIKNDGSFLLNLDYFEYATGFKMISKKFEKLFQKPARGKNIKIDEFYMNIAASIQKVTEDIVIKICEMIKKNYNVDNLCLAGGVALNCVCNGILQKRGIFKNIWVQPAAGDAGGSLGAALSYVYLEKRRERNVNNLITDSMSGSLLGPQIKSDEIEKNLVRLGAKFLKVERTKLNKIVAKKISEGKLFGWFQDKMEFGPRALGNRSIIADPRDPDMKKKLNMSIKFREGFRPFAPSVLEEKASDWFDFNAKSPYMQFVAKVKTNKQSIPAVTHVDSSARLQTVNKETNPKFYQLIEEFYKITKVPILINTSFNINNEPIVNSIEDAYKCFLTTELDYLVCGEYLIDKKEQFSNLIKMFNKTFSKHSDIYVFDIIKSSTIEVSKFYSKDPFPNYKSSDNKSSILEIGNKNQLLKEFKETIGQNKDVLEVGCGTGQLSNYLAIGTNNRIVSIDPTLKSLEIANTFSKKNNIQNITYVKADITEDIFKNHLFDFIWCNGVLHHTEDPYKSFQSLIHTLKPKGYIVLGMYNFLGRIRTKFRKYLYKIFGKRLIMIMDPILRKLKSENQIDAWIRDQYAHPLESIHSYDEILKWFKINDIEYISSIPHSNFNYFLRKKHFKKENNGNFFSRFLNQFFMIFNKYGDDGGLFIFIGKKK